MLDPTVIAELEAALEKATPAPWEHKHGVEVQDMNCTVLAITEGDRFDEADAALIALARNRLPALIATAKEAVALREAVELIEQKSRGHQPFETDLATIHEIALALLDPAP